MIIKTALALILMFNLLCFTGCDVNDSEPKNITNSAYQIILDKYREAENSDFKECDKNYVDGLEVFVNPDNKPYYALYDIDKNGVLELFIGTRGHSIINIWTLKNNDTIRLFSNGFGVRNRCWLLENDIILNEGSGSSSIHVYNFYKMSDDEVSVELENGFVREYIYNTDNPIITQTNATGSQEITTDEFEEIMISYTGITAFPFDYEQLDKAKLDWKAI